MEKENDSHVQISVRLPERMIERIRNDAKANRRSMNGEIVYQLEQVLPASETKTAPGGEFGDATPDAVRT